MSERPRQDSEGDALIVGAAPGGAAPTWASSYDYGTIAGISADNTLSTLLELTAVTT
jgi:hypothetical protein